jgi:hypothetical protein
MDKKLHFNKPQLKSMLIGAGSEMVVAGRGTGKSEGILAPKSAQCYLGTMPRGTGVAVSATYSQAFTRTLPGLIAGWQNLGYIMDHHFLVGRKPSEKWKKMWNWKGPYRPPLDYKYFISWFNGGGCHIISQDRKGSSNGITIDWIIGDEAKLLSEEKLKTELFPANRGLIPAFACNPYHHGLTFTTDMPVGSSGRWILDKINDMDKEAVNQIWQLQVARYKLNHFLKSANKGQQTEIKKQITIIDDELRQLRKGLLYYQEASTLENIHALGIDYIKQQLRDTTQFQFDTQILNLRPLKLENGFYPDFDEEQHGYFSENEDYFDATTIDYSNPQFDCRKDKDLNMDAPLHIALDYNRRIHPLLVVQDYPDEIRFLKGMHALYPNKLDAAVTEFCNYYRPMRRRLVYYWYDHTAVGEDRQTRICDEVMAILRRHKFVVKPMYMGKAPNHEKKYRMWGNLLTANGTYKKRVTFNRENCDKLILSMYNSQAERRKDGFGKDKTTEHDSNVPAEESTHYSDTADQLVTGILESGLSFSNTNYINDTIMMG